MANSKRYQYEADLKDFIEQADPALLAKRLCDFVDVAQVDTVRLLGAALGFKKQD